MASSFLRALKGWFLQRPGRRHLRPGLEPLEPRLAPATHTWTGKGPDNLWSDPLNWTNGTPWLDPITPSNPRIIVFNNNTTSKDDLPTASVDQIKFSGSNNTVLGTGSNTLEVDGDVNT